MPEYLCRKCGLIRVPEGETTAPHGLRFHTRCGYVVKEAAERVEELATEGGVMDRPDKQIYELLQQYQDGRIRPRGMTVGNLTAELTVVYDALLGVTRAAHAAGRAEGLEAGAEVVERLGCSSPWKCQNGHWNSCPMGVGAAIRALKGQE